MDNTVFKILKIIQLIRDGNKTHPINPANSAHLSLLSNLIGSDEPIQRIQEEVMSNSHFRDFFEKFDSYSLAGQVLLHRKFSAK